MRRILFVTQTYNVWGGMEHWLHDFTLWLERNGWDVHAGLARGARWNDADAFLRAHPHLRAREIDVRVGTATARESAIAKSIERVDPDLVVPILTGSIFGAVARAKERGSRARLVIPVQSLIPELFVNVREWFPIVDGVVTTNRLFHRWLVRELGEEERIAYVRQGAPAPATGPRVPSTDGPLRVGYVGRIEQPAKRVLDLIPFAQRLERGGERRRFEIHLFGAGAAEAGLRQSGLPFVLHGYRTREQLEAEAWPMLDALVLFSETEGATPFAVCEAMMHGVVPVISRYPGQIAEAFVVDGENGLTFPVGDTDRAAEHVLHLAGDGELLRRLSMAAAASTRNDTLERMHRDYAAAFERVLGLPLKNGPVARREVTAGRLDRMLGSETADRLRALLRRHYPHDASRAEWPDYAPVVPGSADAVMAELMRLEGLR